LHEQQRRCFKVYDLVYYPADSGDYSVSFILSLGDKYLKGCSETMGMRLWEKVFQAAY